MAFFKNLSLISYTARLPIIILALFALISRVPKKNKSDDSYCYRGWWGPQIFRVFFILRLNFSFFFFIYFCVAADQADENKNINDRTTKCYMKLYTKNLIGFQSFFVIKNFPFSAQFFLLFGKTHFFLLHNLKKLLNKKFRQKNSILYSK